MACDGGGTTKKRSYFQRQHNKKILIWNIAGLHRKLKVGELIKYIGDFDVVVLLKTWIAEKDASKTIAHLPKTHAWSTVAATREHGKGRAKGGILVGMKSGIQGQIKILNEQTIKIQMKDGDNEWAIYGVYLRERRRATLDAIEKGLEEDEDGHFIVAGDFNARCGELGGTTMQQRQRKQRKSRDTLENTEGKELISWAKRTGMRIMNGEMTGDESGQFTFIENSKTVIDYAFANMGAWQKNQVSESGREYTLRSYAAGNRDRMV